MAAVRCMRQDERKVYVWRSKYGRHVGRMENIMFDFRIIVCADGVEIIDRNLKTPYEALTPAQMAEYAEMDNRLAYMDRMERKARAEAERQRKLARNPIYKIACLCGLV